MIDWEEIWKIHAPHYKDGYAQIPLEKDAKIILKPGPGFGDLSHPTTALMLHFLKPLAKDKIVVDIGTGSGILSIGAALLGAKAVYPFEIDPDAIAHAKENFQLNNLNMQINRVPDTFDLVCINMISSEQRIAFAEYPFLKEHPHLLLTSGLLEKEKGPYLREMATYSFVQEKRSKEWLALVLESKTCC